MVKATGVILAGGKSRRMGVDKAFLAVGQEAMIERVAAELMKVFDEVLLSVADKETGVSLGLKAVPDLFKGGGPLGGIHASLQVATHQKCLVVACDMPFVSAALASFMVEQGEGYDVAVPRHGIHLQPLFAIYSKTCIPAIEQFLLTKRRKVAGFFPLVRVNYVDENHLRALADIDTAFFNVNTPSDLDRARDILCNNEAEPEVGRPYC